MMVDLDIENQASENFVYFMVSNVPGTNVEMGQTIYKYIPPFVYDFDADRDPAFMPESNFEHNIAFMVFEQQAEITGQTEETDICPRLVERIQVRI